MIDWEIFFGDSSSENDLMNFASKQLKFKEWVTYYEVQKDYCEESNHILRQRKAAVKQMIKLGYKKARPLAVRALRRRGWSYNDYNNCLC